MIRAIKRLHVFGWRVIVELHGTCPRWLGPTIGLTGHGSNGYLISLNATRDAAARFSNVTIAMEEIDGRNLAHGGLAARAF